MAVKLTEGAIAVLSSGGAQATDLKPVLQVADIKLVNTQNQNSNNERYRILLSDGSYLQQGMLATQRNELVRSQQLRKGSIVQLTEFVCNNIQNRMIIIIVDLKVILEICEPIGEPKPYAVKNDGDTPQTRPSAQMQSSINQNGVGVGNLQSFGGNSLTVSVPSPTIGGSSSMNPGSHAYGKSAMNPDPGRHNLINPPSLYTKHGSNSVFQQPGNSYMTPVRQSYQQPHPMYTNRGPVAKNEAPPRIIPIAALNPYQGRWTIKARVTAKGDLRHYNNPRGDGKVFSFDLLDSDGGEIRATCFNAVAEQFYPMIERGNVYLISKGSLKPAQKAFNHLRNDHEILLESTSTIQPCFDDDASIPRQQFHFRPITEIEGTENNSVLDLIGVVSSISPASSIIRKNGSEAQKRTLHLKDMSGHSVEVTLWGNFCHAEGQNLQNICDSGVFPILAVKSARVNDFNGKAVGTISTSQLFIEPDFPEAFKLRAWFEKEGKNTPSVSISKDSSAIARNDVRKNISQIKDEKLGTSEKPDWITVSATITYMKVENFCYTACPIMIGDRQCNKKVTNNGDGKWRCDRCDQTIDECDYRYILQFQIQDHTGITWVTAFQESGEDIMGISAKDLYYMKYEAQDDDRFTDVVRNALFSKYILKLKVKEETFSDEQRVKSTVVKAEKVNFSSETKFLLDLMDKLKREDPMAELPASTSGMSNFGSGNFGIRESMHTVGNYTGSGGPVNQNQMGSFRNQYGNSRFGSTVQSGNVTSCDTSGAAGHNSTECPSFMNAQGISYGGSPTNRAATGSGGSGGSSECYKCHQFGHWARDCPGLSNIPPAYGSGNAMAGRYNSISKQYVGGF